MIAVDASPADLDLGEWYEQRARPFLAKTAPPAVLAQVDRAWRWMAPWNRRSVAAPICVLGESGVGKSSLINALLSDDTPILPGGGVGPLTAIPVVVRWAPEPFLAAECLGRERIEALLAALMEVPSRPPGIAGTDAMSDRARMRHFYQRMARLLVCGNQYGPIDVDFLTACLRGCLSPGSGYPRDATSDICTRLKQVEATLDEVQGAQAWIMRHGWMNPAGFLHALADHGAGHLAPITRQIEIAWLAPVLETGVTIIDLPGLGVVHDQFVHGSDPYLRDADAILWVVDRSGLPESCARMLRQTGFFRRLIVEPDDQRPALVIAVVKLDLSTDEARSKERIASPPGRSWGELRSVHFEQATSLIRQQIDAEVACTRKDLGTEAPQDRPPWIDVHAVLPREHQKFFRRDAEDKSRLKAPEESGIPQLRASLRSIGSARQGDFLSIVDSVLAACEQALETDAPDRAAKAVVLRGEARACVRHAGKRAI